MELYFYIRSTWIIQNNKLKIIDPMNSFLFYFWSLATVVSAWKVITSKNPILSVFWLVLAFANASLLLLLLGVEFLPILFVIVYVGAIAILFLFVVMLLNIKLVEITENATRYAPIGIITGFIFLYQILYSFDSINTNNSISDYSTTLFTEFFNQTNIELVGQLLYTEYWIYFLVSSLVLLVSMVCAIVLCLYHETGIKRQDLFAQVATQYDKTIYIRK